ncbi:MAG: rod shape-determining protein MreC [Armatimonadetes bacterium]|nr:rod shape-determining protein MreC [Armatimonadota bacterium]
MDIVTTVVQTTLVRAGGGIDHAAQNMRDSLAGVGEAPKLRKENEKLVQQLAAAQIYLDSQAALESQISALKALQSLPDFGRTKVGAQIIGYSPFDNRITLSVGEDKGIKPSMPVANGQGLLAQISSVGPTTSTATLITSPSLRVAALLQGSNKAVGLVRGETSKRLVMEIVEDVEIHVGDRVVTSGFTPFYPRGINIGDVVEVRDDVETGSKRAYIVPKAKLAQDIDVVVLK